MTQQQQIEATKAALQRKGEAIAKRAIGKPFEVRKPKPSNMSFAGVIQYARTRVVQEGRMLKIRWDITLVGGTGRDEQFTVDRLPQ